MGEPKRCPSCGRPGGVKTGSLFDFEEWPEDGGVAPRRELICRTDRYLCDHCGGVWDEEADAPVLAGRQLIEGVP